MWNGSVLLPAKVKGPVGLSLLATASSCGELPVLQSHAICQKRSGEHKQNKRCGGYELTQFLSPTVVTNNLLEKA